MLCGQDEPCAALSFDIGTGLLEPWRCVKIARRGGAVQLRSNASDKENRRRGRGRVDDRRRRCLKIGNDGAAAPFLQLALPSFRRSLALGNVAKGRSTDRKSTRLNSSH